MRAIQVLSSRPCRAEYRIPNAAAVDLLVAFKMESRTLQRAADVKCAIISFMFMQVTDSGMVKRIKEMHATTKGTCPGHGRRDAQTYQGAATIKGSIPNFCHTAWDVKTGERAASRKGIITPHAHITDSEMFNLLKEPQLANAAFAISVTEAVMINLVKDLQPVKALLQMVITCLGMLRFAKVLQPLKVTSPASVTASETAKLCIKSCGQKRLISNRGQRC